MNNNELKVGTFNLSRSSLIEASAGTGKTYTITYLVLRLLLGSRGFDDNHPESQLNYGYNAGPLELKNILVVTFTKAAASDLKARIREKIVTARSVFEKVSKKGIEILNALDLEEQMKSLVREMVLVNGIEARACALLLLNAERSIDEAPICTIHSFCTSALHKIYTFEAGESFGVQLCEDISEQSMEAKNTVWRELFYKGDENSKKLAALLSVDSDDNIFNTLNLYQDKLERVRNTDEKEGYFGYNLLNIKAHSSGDIRKTVVKVLGNLDAYLSDFLVFADRVKSIFNEYEVITDNDEPGSFFTRIKGAAPKFKNSAKAGYKLLRELCSIKDDEERKLCFIRGSFPDGNNFNSISRVTDRSKYPEIFRNSEKIIEIEDLYMEMASLHNKFDEVKSEILFDIAIMAEQKLDEILDRDNLVGFDGIIRRLDYVLNYKEGSKDTLPGLIRASYPVAMIDEFQDTDPVQFSIFSKLYLNENAKKTGACCYLIGDPKQSIYGFRKADIHSYLKARSLIETLYGNDSIYTLSTNFRSQEQIVEGVNGIFLLRTDPFFFEENSKDNIEFNKVNAKIKTLGNSGKCSFRFCNEPSPSDNFSAASNYVDFISKDDVYDEYPESKGKTGIKTVCKNFIARKLANAVKVCLSHGLLDSVSGDKIISRGVKASDIAILVRSGSEAKLIQAALKENGISSVYYSDSSKVFDEESSDNSIAEYELILYLIEAMEDYPNRGKVRRLLLSQLCSASTLDSLDSQSDSLELEVALLKECREIWEKNGFFPAFSKWANDERHQCLKNNLSFTGGERMVTNLWHLAELLQSARTHEQGIQAQKRWYTELRSNPSALSDSDMFSKRLESEASQVAIYTIFKSKGLEFPLVFMPYLWTDMRAVTQNDAFYYDEKKEKLYFDILGTEATLNQKKTSDLQEDARLLYVALTRACAANFMYIAQISEKNPNSLISEFTKSEQNEKTAFSEAQSLLAGPITDVLLKNKKPEDAENAVVKNPFRVINDDFYKTVESSAPVQNDAVSELQIAGPSEFDESFSGIRQDYRISSYSGIVARSEDGGPSSSGQNEDIPKENFTRFNFPKSAIAGTYLHSLMEYCDFSNSLNDATRLECIKKAELTNEAGILKRWTAYSMKGLSDEEIIKLKTDVLSEWLSDVVQSKLPCGDSKTVRLCDLEKGDWLCELEFLFPSDKFTSDKLEALRHKNAAVFAQEKGITLDNINFSLAQSELSGFVKGFIDLAIKVGDGSDAKFYVIDYKSNFIGSSVPAYSYEAVARNMLEHCYDVQYLFYSLAMHRFLKTRIENYSYEKNFGGIIYLYLRGMEPDSSNSIIYTKPKQEIIEELSSIFSE